MNERNPQPAGAPLDGSVASAGADRSDQDLPAETSESSLVALQVEYWPIGRLIPFARNARTHSPAQIAEIAGSIRAFGFTNPILVGADGDVVAGHGRLAAARIPDLQDVPVIVLRGLGDLQRRQLVIADNRIALNAGWDLAMLRLELNDLAALGADLHLLGFSDDELARTLALRGSAGLTDENDAPALAEDAVTSEGDIWCLGAHRIACGDSTDAVMVGRLFGDVAPQLMVTDPPYGVDYDPAWRHRLGVNKSMKRGRVRNDARADWSAAWALFPGDIAYVWHGALHATTVAESLSSNGFAIRAQIVWAKERLVIGRGDYHWQHEPCWYAVRKRGFWTGDRKQTTLWTIPSGGQDAETAHSTQKPVECMRRPILNNSNPGQAVYDPFLGSGTTLIAGETAGRVCFGMEIDPRFVDVAIRRWQAFTGGKAIRLSDGRGFDEVGEGREAETAHASSMPGQGSRTPKGRGAKRTAAGRPPDSWRSTSLESAGDTALSTAAGGKPRTEASDLSSPSSVVEESPRARASRGTGRRR